MSKIIISCAVAGSVHTPSMSPYLPVTAVQIADQAIADEFRAVSDGRTPQDLAACGGKTVS